MPKPSQARQERGTRKRCPKCGSTKVITATLPKEALEKHGPYGPTLSSCQNCRALWEPAPDDNLLDDDGTPFPFMEPCDNCAFRPGSNEQQDREKWREMLSQLKQGGRFYCHKGVTIEPCAEHGFAYPLKPDGTHDTKKLRLCRGFLNAWSKWMTADLPADQME